MPTVSVKRELLFEKIGQKYSDEEFDKLCFEFGIELDDVAQNEHNETEYKIDIPANRYDLLSVEGIATALAVFTNKIMVPRFTKTLPSSPIETFVDASTSPLRPFIVTAALRGVTLTPDAYASLIDLQEKLHHNICRKRTLVAIGVHDLDTLSPPFRYSADSPKDITFKPLNQQKEFRADELMEFYQKDTHLKPYLHIIKDEPRYPIIRDSKAVVLSMPPIINGDHSKVTLNTKNIFIEATATDLRKAQVVIDMMVATLSLYCKNKFETEATRIIYETTKETKLSPELQYSIQNLDVNKTNKVVGVEIEADAMAKSLSRMGLTSKVLSANGSKEIAVEIPPTRHDIMHQIDIMEDVAIAYGYSNITPKLPPTPTVASQYPLNKLTLQLRESVAQAGFTEALTFSLCSIEDECEKILQPRDVKERTLALVANPKSSEFQAVRHTLLPGLLKTIQANRNMPLPLRLFEISDVVHLDNIGSDTGATNCRHLCAVHYHKTPGFEVIHGLLDRIMQLLEVKFKIDYELRPSEDPTYFPGRCAEVVYKGKVIGKLGVLHPKVVENFEGHMPTSALEIEIQDFL